MPQGAMPNAFLVIRTVFFALLVYFHVLILLFALWNIVVTRSSRMSAPGASVFLFISSIFTFVLVPVAYLAEIICVRARPAHVRIECAWTALVSILQLAASIDVTLNGPAVYCQMDSPWGMCASSSLLAHISWLIMLIDFSYCLVIYVASTAHATSIPNIWITPVPYVPWFCLGAEAPAPVTTSYAPARKHAKTPSSSSSSREASCDISRHIAERWEKLSRTESQPVLSDPILFTKDRQSVDSSRPAWARLRITRRGIDSPFTKSIPKRRELPVVLPPPPSTRSTQVVTARDSHSTEVGELSETGTHSRYLTLTPRISTVSPWGITNLDLPLPCPRLSLSDWVRTDVVRGITVRRAGPILSS